MKKEKIIIQVCGKTKSGKSVITYLLKEFMKQHGFQVDFDEGIDYFNEFDFDRRVTTNFEKGIEYVKDNRIIVIKQEQLNANYVI